MLVSKKPRSGLYRGLDFASASGQLAQAASAGGTFGATVVVMEPPAASTAAFAVAEAPETVMVIARVIVPSASRRMPSLSLDARPAA